MKLLKKLAIFISAIALCIGASACMGGDNASSSASAANSSVESSLSVESSAAVESSQETPATVYTFIILNSDGTPATNVQVQLCVLGNSAACYMPISADANGVVEYNPAGFPGEGEYEIHLLDANYAPLEFNGPVSTPTIYSTITLTLK